MKDEIKQKFIELLDSIEEVQKLEYNPNMVFIFKMKERLSRFQLNNANDDIRAALSSILGQDVKIVVCNADEMDIKIIKGIQILDSSDEPHE